MSSRGVWALLWTIAAFLVLLPDLVGLDRWSPFAQIVAFRPMTAVLVLLVGIAALLPKPTRLAGVTVAVVALIAIGLVIPRLWRLHIPMPGRTALNVMTVNVRMGEVPATAVANLIRAHKVDLVSIPEADEKYRKNLERILDDKYIGFSKQSGDSSRSALSVLQSRTLGELQGLLYAHTNFPTWILTGEALGDLRFVAFHAYPPVPGRTHQWMEDLDHLKTWCANGSAAIIAGDFNATLDHGVFRRAIHGCDDAARQLGRGVASTWPEMFPLWMGTQIDHVLYQGTGQAEKISFLKLHKSDHRAVLTRIGVASRDAVA